MKAWGFDSVCWLITSCLSFLLILLFYSCSWGFSGGSHGFVGFVTPYLCLDGVGFYLLVLTVVISFCLIGLGSWMSSETLCLILLSQLFSGLCYVCSHVLFFWLFYEMSILCLVYLVLKDSPYSERYTALWYFVSYAVFCSIPMLLVLIHYSLVYGGFSVLSWKVYVEGDWWVMTLLGLLFVSKIPLFPFQVWLPIVHAEASSVVSACLSGYVMKLGVLGVYRFVYWVLPNYLFIFEYVCVVLFISLCVFVCASFELDCKRWLAFLSLGHIGFIPVCLSISEEGSIEAGFSYCLGHGLSSCATFVLFWFLSSIGGGRSWLVLKSVIPCAFMWNFVVVSCFCMCSSFPTCLQFFSELLVAGYLSWSGGLLFFLFCCYLFMGSLVSFIGLGFMLVRGYSVRLSSGVLVGPLMILGFLSLVGFSCFLFF